MINQFLLKRKSAKKLFGVFIFLISIVNYAQEEIKVSGESKKEFTIDNCVNQFDINESIPTKVGYQYWFADKDF